MMYSTLIDPTDLARQLVKGGMVVLDCRFSLADTGEGLRHYKQAHIPGAHYVHLDNDLSSTIIAGESGRHPLPDQARFVLQLWSWGVNDDTQVVAYDDTGGAMAARAWWMCRWVGHEACAVLDGSFQAWSALKLPLSAENPAVLAGAASLRSSLAPMATAGQILDGVKEVGQHRLVDARAPERYSGEVEPLDKLAGHIPGAVNLPFTDNLDKQGRFLPADELRERFSSLATKGQLDDVTHYCGSGVTASHNILAMMHAGLGMTTLYAGSWSEWVQDDSRPVAQTTAP